MEKIKICGARVNNLKNIDIEIPLNKIVCIAGPSGSGKTSLAFHTIFTESKRRFLNSFPTYLKFFSERPAPVDVDLIEPVLPVFGLPQVNPVIGARSVVSDLMNLTEQLQNLYANHSVAKCPNHFLELESSSIEQFVSDKFKLDEKSILYFFTTKENFITYLKDSPFPSRSLSPELNVEDFDKDHEYWELLRIRKKNLSKLEEKLKAYKDLNLPLYVLESESEKFQEIKLDSNLKCPKGDFESSKLKNMSHFSPYNALGACSDCNGFGARLEYDDNKVLNMDLSVNEGGAKLLMSKRFSGIIEDLEKVMKREKISLNKPLSKLPKKFFQILFEGKNEYCGYNELFKYLESKKYKAPVRIFIRSIQKDILCETCNGSRVNKISHNHFIFKDKISYLDIWDFTVEKLLNYFEKNREHLLDSNKSSLKLLDKTIKILKTALGIGLGHLNLTRKVKTVSAGEYQRLLLLKYLSYEGTGALFIFDEPSLGLSLKESKILLTSFKHLITQGNSVLLVEHSEFFHKSSDYFIEMGPKSGKEGGEVLYAGKYKDTKSNRKKLQPLSFDLKKRKYIKFENPSLYGRKFSTIEIPVNELSLAIGDSGSGKSSVLVNTVAQEILKHVEKPILNIPIGDFSKVKIPNTIQDVMVVDANINRYSSRSTVGSMTGLFAIVRKHFLKTPYAKSMNLKDGHLSSNSDLGRCPTCEGKGVTVVEMQFLEDIVLKCEDCNGKKIKDLYSQLSDGEMTVSESYNLPVNQVFSKISLTPKYRRIIEYMKTLKIDYLSLDRPVKSLSGGEKQRLYLLSKLQSKVESTLIIIENVSFGLSTVELVAMCEFLKSLVELGNTVVVIDKNKIFKEVATNLIVFS